LAGFYNPEGGICNLYKYTKLYSGGEPELIEGEKLSALMRESEEHIWKTIIIIVSTT